MARISKEMTFNEVLEQDPTIAAILMAAGMGCVHCMAAAGESLEDGCLVHGIDPDEMVDEINTYLENKPEE